MIVSEIGSRVTSRWLPACVLLCATVLLPMGTTYAQDYDAVGKRLRAAVQAGELTGEQARTMLGALRKTVEHEGDRNAGDEDERVAKYRGIAARIKAAVEAGKLSDEDAEKKLIAIRMEMWPPEKEDGENEDEAGLRAVGEYLQGIGERIHGAVAEGKLSEEDGWAKWHEVKAETIKGAVAAGKISREEAGLLWREIEKSEAGARLKMAVEKGELTEEEARAKWAEIHEENDDERDEREDEEDVTIEPVPTEEAHKIGKALLEVAPVDFAGDPSQAVGVFAEDDEDDDEVLGMILVPADGLNEDDAEMEIGDSAPLALLFTSAPILPAADGHLIDRDKLHAVTFTDDEGHEHGINCMMLIVKRIAEEDYRLYCIGKNAIEPLIDGRFDEGEGPGQTPLALEVNDTDEESETAAVIITVFNKFQAAFRAGVTE